MKTIIFDAKDAVLGRMGTQASKELLKGNSVIIINSQDAVISGKKEQIIENIRRKRRMGKGGSLKGPKYIRQSDRLLKRMLRGMLPWDKPKGREAYKRLKCYTGENQLSENQLKQIKKLNHKKPFSYVTIKEIVEALKWTTL